jgi:predicted kinase
MKTLILLRGLPGSGKSTHAMFLADKAWNENNSFTIRSTDKQFEINGVYTFNPRLLGVNHAKNQQLVEQDMLSGIDIIIVDNTNIKRNDFKFYVDAAERHGYKVVEEVIGKFDEDFIKICAERNTHGVPIEAIRRMAQNFQE